VNSVGVDLNTASVALLARVSGLSNLVAQRIVERRDREGPFRSREELKSVGWLGAKAFELAAGFLRIRDGDNPLDASAVHPEAYPVVERIVARLNRSAREIIGRRDALRGVQASEFIDERFGEPTIRDILTELEKPGRDPRGEFRTVTFKEGVEELSDLRPGMRLQGVVTNVANFGAFVDIGVHQDGLVHISQLADRYVADPRDVVKAGQVVSVMVVEVDAARRRIALSMRSDAKPSATPARAESSAAAHRPAPGAPHRGQGAATPRAAAGSRAAQTAPATALGEALARVIRR
jgi:uncharacterized protein